MSDDYVDEVFGEWFGEEGAPTDPSLQVEPPRAPSPPEIPAVPMTENFTDPVFEEWGLDTSVEYAKRTGLTGEEDTSASTLLQALSAAPDPAAAMSQLRDAETIAKALHKPVPEVLANLDAISEAWMGQVTPPARFAQVLGDHLYNGEIQNTMGEIANQMRDAQTPEQYEALLAQMQELEGKIRDVKDVPRPFIAKWLEGAAQSTPMMAHSMMEGGMTGMMAAGAGAATLSPAASAAAPFTGGLSYPALYAGMMSVGMVVGSTEQMRRTLGGLSYWDMIKKGIPHDIASPISHIDGLIQAALESIGDFWLMGAKIPGVSSVVKSVGESVAEKILVTGVGAKMAADLGAKAFVGGVGEGIENTAQSFAEMVKDQFALELARKRGLTPDMTDMQFDRLVEDFGKSFSEGFGPGVIFSTVFAGTGMGVHIQEATALRDSARSIPKKELYIQAEMASKPEGSMATDQAWAEYLGKVWDSQNAARAKVGQAKSAPTGAEPGAPRMVPAPEGEAKPAPAPEEGVRRSTLAKTAQGAKEVIAFGTPEARTGYVQTTSTSDTVLIENVVDETETPAHIKDMVVRTAMENPEKTIEWNPDTEELAAVKEDILQDYPRLFDVVKTERTSVMTAKAFEEAATKAIVEKDRDSVGTLTALSKAMAEAHGMDVDSFFSRVFSGVEVRSMEQMNRTRRPEDVLAHGAVNAAVEFRDLQGNVIEHGKVSTLSRDQLAQVRALLVATEGTDLPTLTHEFFHAVEALYLDERQISAFERALNKQRKDWTREDKEFLADNWEIYLSTGKSPVKGLAEVFRRLADMLARYVEEWKAIARRYPGKGLSPELSKAYDSMFYNFTKNTGKETPPVQPTNDLDTLIEMATEIYPWFKKWVTDLGEKYGAVVQEAPDEFRPPDPNGVKIKAKNRILGRKVNDSHGPQEVLDIAGITLVFDDLQGITDLLLGEADSEEFVRIKDRIAVPTWGGYRDVLINVRTPNGIIMELQINIQQAMEAKEGVGHVLYEAMDQVQAMVDAGKLPGDEAWVLVDYIAGVSQELYSLAFEKAREGAPFSMDSLDISTPLEKISERVIELGKGESVLSEPTSKRLRSAMDKAMTLSSQSTKRSDGSLKSIEPPNSSITKQPVERKAQVKTFPREAPVQASPAPEQQISDVSVQEIPIPSIGLSKDVPNFKEGASSLGVVEALRAGRYERIGTAPIVVWERTDGRLEVITGRHRLDLAKRLGEKTIPAQVVKESEGWTAAKAMTFDAESNIRSEKGTVKDYANYVRNSDISEEEAFSRGLLARDKGRKGWAIGKYAEDDLYTLFRNKGIGEGRAAAIAEAAPNDAGTQAVGIRAANTMKADELYNYVQAVKQMQGGATAAEQLDMFGRDDSAIREAEAVAREATAIQRELAMELSALNLALRLGKGERAKILSQYGFKAGDEGSIRQRIAILEVRSAEWENWATSPAKYQELRKRAGLEFKQEVIDESAQASAIVAEDEGASLFHHEDAASEEMLQALAPLAVPFNTMEEFIRSTEEKAGEPVSESQRGVYQAVWERAHPQAPVAQVAEKAIPLPELEEEYDHEEKIQAGAVASDPALAASMESGALSSAEVERRIEGLLPQEGRAEIQELEKEIEELQGDVMKAFTDGADWQKYIDDLQMEKVQDKAKIRKAKLIAQKWAKVEALKQEFRQKEANRRAAVKYKAAVARVIKKIMAPPPVSISYRGYAEEINRIQRGLDPAHHQTVKGNPTKWEKERQASRDFFARNPDAAALVDQKKLDKIYSTSLADMPLAELEEILEQLDGLRKLGKLKRSLQLQQRLRARNKARMILANTVLRGEPPEEVIGRAKASGPGFTAWLKTLKPDRVARLLDGALEGAAPGEFERLLWDRVNEEWEAEKKAYHARVDPVIKAMEDLKLTADPWKLAPGYTYLGERLDIRHNGKTFVMSDGNQPTLEQAMYWYIGMQNDRTARALELGNNLPKEVLDAGVELVRNNPNLKAFADIIEKDGSENFENLRQAFIDLNNFDLPAEEHYVRMRRMKISYESRDDEVTAELVGRTGSMQKFVAANPTFKRIDVPDEYQSPIDDRLFSTWLRGVEIQEAYIHKSQMIRDLQAIFGSDQVTKAVQQKFGPAMNEWIKNYINFLAAGDDYARQQGWEKLSRIMRSNAAIAWLGFNLLSAGKQLTSTLDGLAEAGPVHLLGASAEFIGNPKKLIEFVREKSATVKYRSPTQELEDLRRLDVNKYEALVKKIGQASMAMLKAEDVAASTIVWKAVYDKALAGNIEEAAAAKAADNAIVRSQPSARPQDVAEIYRSGEVAKWFTMMTSDASAKWNRLTFDVPAALVNGQLGFAAMTLIGISLSGLAIAAMSGAFSGDDDEEKKKALVFSLFSQQLESLPLVGNDFSSALQRGIGIGRKFPSSGVKLIPALTYLERVPSQFARQDWHGMAENLAEGIGTASGLPVVGPRRAVKAIQTWDWTPLLGWPVEEGTR